MESKSYQEKRRGYSFFEQNRRRLSKAFLVVCVLVLILTRGGFTEGGLADRVFFWLGLLLIIKGILGRVWSTLYIGGRKNAQLVRKGPYSICRNPLYLFSFLGGLGAALVFENILLILMFVGFFSVYYPKVIESEEGRLQTYFGDDFTAFKATTPAFFPNMLLLDMGNRDDISTVRVWKNLLDSSLFLAAVPLSYLLNWLHASGYLPSLITIP